jgi:type VI secretion system secreted protein Hcp
MRRQLLAFALPFVVVLGMAGPADAAVEYFLQVPDAPGESADAKFPGWINVKEYEEHIAGSTRSFAFTANVNRSTPRLVGAAVTGKVFSTVTLVDRRTGGQQQTFYNVKFENVRITSVTSNATASGDVIPLYRFTFTCDRATWTYYVQKPDGTLDLQNPIVVTADFKAAVAPLPTIEIPRVR